MEDESQTEMVAQFMGITGLSDETTCRGLLEAFGWSVDGAATAYFDDPSGFAPPAALPPAAHAAPMTFRPPERLVDPLPMFDNDEDEEDEDEDEDIDYRPQPRQPQQPVYVDLDDDDDGDGDDPMRSALFPGGRPGRGGGFAPPRAAFALPNGAPDENNQLQRILAESAQLARQAAGSLRAGADGPADSDEFASALARSQAAFAQEEERLLARAMAMSERAAKPVGTGAEDDPLDVDDAYDPALRAALEASVRPPSAERPAARVVDLEAEDGAEDGRIDADALLAASLAAGDDDDDATARHLAHPDGLEASYAAAARRAFVSPQPASARDLLLREQNREYEESLAMDRAREDSLAESAAREVAAADAASAREASERAAREAAAATAAAKLAAARAAVAAEPAAGGEGVVTVAVRLPEGGRLMRRFERASRVGALYDWVLVAWTESGATVASDDFVLVSHMPRTLHADRDKTLAESGLTDKQCMVFVEQGA